MMIMTMLAITLVRKTIVKVRKRQAWEQMLSKRNFFRPKTKPVIFCCQQEELERTLAGGSDSIRSIEAKVLVSF